MIKNPISLDAKITHKYDDIIYTEYPLKNIDGCQIRFNIPDNSDC